MPFLNIGSGDDLILELPTRRTENWNDNFLNNFAVPASQHDHTGAGKGRKITANAILDGAITPSKLLLTNNVYVQGRNQADTLNINVIKVNASDLIEFGIILSNVDITHNKFITGRNAAGTAPISIVKVSATDKLEFGADVSIFNVINNAYVKFRNAADTGYVNGIKLTTTDVLEISPKTNFKGNIQLSSSKIEVLNTFALADNQAAFTNITGLTITEVAGKTATLEYSIYVDATADLTENGILDISFNGVSWDIVPSFTGEDSLTTFDILAGQFRYKNVAYAGFVASTLTFTLIER